MYYHFDTKAEMYRTMGLIGPWKFYRAHRGYKAYEVHN